MKQTTKIIISMIITVFTFLVICVGDTIIGNEEVKEYNNGICPNCGEQFITHTHFEKGDGENYTIYECEQCDTKNYIKTRLIEK